MTLSLTTLAQGPQFQWETVIRGGTSFSSVNQFSDLNQDGVLDFVIGGSKEGGWARSGIFALSGSNGSILWELPAKNQIYMSARFLHLTADSIEDVLIGGRDAQLYAINGKNGEILWEFWTDTFPPARHGYYNFYNCQLIEDQDQDEVEDILISNGGNASAAPSDTNRPVGKLMIISGKSGEVLSQLDMPDGRETYFAPILLSDKQTVIFGSGGETIGGSLYSITMDQLMTEDSSSIHVLDSDSVHGFIAAPTVWQESGYDKIAVPKLNQTVDIYHHSASGFNRVNRIVAANKDAYVSPVPGYFNSDNHLDFAIVYASGVFPFYTSYTYTVYDGLTSAIISSWESSGIYDLQSCNALDLNNDGIDEMLIARNYDNGFSKVEYRTSFWVKSFQQDTLYELFGDRPGITLYSQPAITDLDKNGRWDMLVTTNLNQSNWYLHDSFSVRRYEWNEIVKSISWPSYMGPNGDGYYHKLDFPASVVDNSETKTRITNPVNKFIELDPRVLEWQLFSSSGKALENGRAHQISTQHWKCGSYFLVLQGQNFYSTHRLVKIN